VPAIERFVRLHHAEPEGSDLGPALYASLHALGSFRARTARNSLDAMSKDPLAPAALREKAAEVLIAIDAPPVSAKAEPIKPEAEEENGADEVRPDPRPFALGGEIVSGVLKPMRGRLVKCLSADADEPQSARVSMVVNGEGNVEGVFVTPTTLQTCIEAVLREARFPPTRRGREYITHVIHAKPPKGAAAKKTPAR
jgi:hypothetical protein